MLGTVLAELGFPILVLAKKRSPLNSIENPWNRRKASGGEHRKPRERRRDGEVGRMAEGRALQP